jgi:hypothetical protein
MKSIYKLLIVLSIITTLQSCITCYVDPEQPRQPFENSSDMENLDQVN